MLDENQVIRVLCNHLTKQGYKIEQQLKTSEKGIDVIARDSRKNRTLLIEAKGGTSSRKGSPRYGRPYTTSQKFDRAAKGVYTAIKTASNLGRREISCLAVPEDEMFHQYLDPILPLMSRLGIRIFFVSRRKVISSAA